MSMATGMLFALAHPYPLMQCDQPALLASAIPLFSARTPVVSSEFDVKVFPKNPRGAEVPIRALTTFSATYKNNANNRRTSKANNLLFYQNLVFQIRQTGMTRASWTTLNRATLKAAA